MMERDTQAIMDRLDGLWGTGSGSRNKGEQLREVGREPKVNFSESSNMGRSKGSTTGRDNPSTKATGSHKLMKSTIIHKELHLQRASIKHLLQTRNLRRWESDSSVLISSLVGWLAFFVSTVQKAHLLTKDCQRSGVCHSFCNRLSCDFIPIELSSDLSHSGS